MENRVVYKNGVINGANFDCTQSFFANEAHSYSLKSRSQHENVWVECSYKEKTEAKATDRLIPMLYSATKAPLDMQQIVRIGIMDENGNTIKTYQLFFSNDYDFKNSIITVSKSGYRKRQVLRGSEEYEEFCKVYDFVNTYFDVYTVRFLHDTRSLIEYDIICQRTPSTIVETMDNLIPVGNSSTTCCVC